MFSFLKKSLSYLVTGSCSIVFAACYGPPVGLENPKLINARNSNNEAIPGLKVTLFQNRLAIDEQFTNDAGSVEFNFLQDERYNYSATIQDVDGSDNLGEFKTKSIDLSTDSFFEVNLEEAR